MQLDEKGVIAALRTEIDHALINNTRLSPVFGQQHGDPAIRVSAIEAVIDRHMLPAAAQMQGAESAAPTTLGMPIEKALARAVKRAMENAGTLPAKEAVKLVPADWHRICDLVLNPPQALSPGSTGETEGWRDIESAPKDGTPFFGVGSDDAYPQPMCWQAYSDEDAEEIGETGYWAYCEDLIGDVTGSATPTHWRPMFERPSAMLSAAGER